MAWVLIFPIVVPLAVAAYFLATAGRACPPRGRKLGGELTNYEPPIELNLSGREFPEKQAEKLGD